MNGEQLRALIEKNVPVDTRGSNDFIQSLVSCVVKNDVEKSGEAESKMNKAHVNKQKQFIQKYQVFIFFQFFYLI